MTKRKKYQLDFSGGPKSWFDLWHTHVDWDGEGNTDWLVRKRNLHRLMELYTQYKQQLSAYPREYQIWISIDDVDSGQDAVYIHTKNPNADNFPYKALGNKVVRTRNVELKKFLETSDYAVIRVDTNEGDVYFLFDRATGIQLD